MPAATLGRAHGTIRLPADRSVSRLLASRPRPHGRGKVIKQRGSRHYLSLVRRRQASQAGGERVDPALLRAAHQRFARRSGGKGHGSPVGRMRPPFRQALGDDAVHDPGHGGPGNPFRSREGA